MIPISLLPFILLSTIFHSSIALQQPPVLECLESGMRLHFPPDMAPDPQASGVMAPLQFCGHVYVKGYFFSRQCHLDYTQVPVAEPFYFHIPYNGDCQVRRERTNDNNIPGVVYSTVVVVQHHKLFLTNNDHAYSLSCFYQDNRHRVDQRVEISDLTTQPLVGLEATPNCTYVVLRSGPNGAEQVANGESVRFANIGDSLVHRWQCTSFSGEELGMLVHSCYVRDGVGSEFALVDDRGCVNDTELMEQLVYSDNYGRIDIQPPKEIINQAESSVNAFKFADQMIVYFSCQITLCERANQGCEGITPPVCIFTTSTSTTTSTTSTTTTMSSTTTTTTTTTTIPEPTPAIPEGEIPAPLPVEGELPILMRNPERNVAAAPGSARQYAANSRYGSHQEAKWIDLYQSKATVRPTSVTNASRIEPQPSLLRFNLFGGGDGARRAPENLFVVREVREVGTAGSRLRSVSSSNKTQNPRLLTLDVAAERMLIFTKDDGMVEPDDERVWQPSSRDKQPSTTVECSGRIECSCSYIQPGWIVAFLVMFQRSHYKGRLNAVRFHGGNLSAARRDGPMTVAGERNGAVYSPYSVPNHSAEFAEYGSCGQLMSPASMSPITGAKTRNTALPRNQI